MESIRTAPKVVITGAGISMDAGLPSGPALVESALVKLSTLLGMPSESVGRLSGALPLEVFFQVVADHVAEETRVHRAANQGLSKKRPRLFLLPRVGLGWQRPVLPLRYDPLVPSEKTGNDQTRGEWNVESVIPRVHSPQIATFSLVPYSEGCEIDPRPICKAMIRNP